MELRRRRQLVGLELNTMGNYRQHRLRSRERGSMLVELMIAMVVLAIGLGGILALLTTSLYANNKSGKDTSSTMLAEHVLEQLSGQQANYNAPPSAPLTIVDCAGTTLNMNTNGALQGAGSGGAYGGNGASLTVDGKIDWTQAYAAIPAGYAMQYVACGAGGRQTAYDVRWDVITITDYSRVVLVSARPLGSTAVGGLQFIVPVNLRTIAGM
jgi:Tfp pilus assembly protein PilV